MSTASGPRVAGSQAIGWRDPRPFTAMHLVLALAPLLPPAVPLEEESERAATALFREHCASCHGEQGDGRGWAELDRQARSFRDGGFSFGNTPEAVLRTIANGIPGTPMPAFDRALDEGQRLALARHVLSLAPPSPDALPGESELVVRQRPLVARGHLPPIAAELPARPRGLLIGTPDGLSAEYRTDDLRLLGVRQGRFCERTDWSGRGGTPLRPLGRLIHLQEGGDPGPAFELLRAAPGEAAPSREALRAELQSTWVRGERAGVAYRLRDAAGRERARVEEWVAAFTSGAGSGFRRSWRIEAVGEELRLALRAADPLPQTGELLEWESKGDPGSLQGGRVELVLEAREDGLRAWLLALPPGAELAPRGGRRELVLELRPGRVQRYELALLRPLVWDASARAELLLRLASGGSR